MERRLTERVQFFQCPQHPTHVAADVAGDTGDITVGLLLDISDEGVQILTDSTISPATDTFELSIQADADPATNFRIATMRRQWSRAAGPRLFRNGFSFAGDVELLRLLDTVLDARDAGRREFRCSLVSVGQTAMRPGRALDTSPALS